MVEKLTLESSCSISSGSGCGLLVSCTTIGGLKFAQPVIKSSISSDAQSFLFSSFIFRLCVVGLIGFFTVSASYRFTQGLRGLLCPVSVKLSLNAVFASDV